MAEKIDAHHHFWRYTAEEYGWIDGRMSQLRRDFLPADLEKEAHSAGFDGVVTVQTRQSLEETTWLLSLVAGSEIVRGVVGWAPIASQQFPADLELFRGQTKAKGLRHLVQDEPDENYLDRPAFNRGIASLKGSDLVYDILIFERQLAAAIRFVDRHQIRCVCWITWQSPEFAKV